MLDAGLLYTNLLLIIIFIIIIMLLTYFDVNEKVFVAWL